MDKVEKKRQKEQYVVEEMIRLYCRKKHPKEKRQEGQMCPDCQRLSDYAKQRCRGRDDPAVLPKKTSERKKSKVSIHGRKDVLCEL